MKLYLIKNHIIIFFATVQKILQTATETTTLLHIMAWFFLFSLRNM